MDEVLKEQNAPSQAVESEEEQKHPTHEENDIDTIAKEVERGNKILNRKEEIIWRGTPRHITMFKFHAIALLMILVFTYLGMELSSYFFVLLIIPFAISGFKFIQIKTHIFEISNKRLKIKKGIIRSVTKEIELYNIKSSVLEENRSGRGYITFVINDADEKYAKIKFPRMNNPAKIHSEVRDIYEEIKLERTKITHNKKR